jgi:hypothetical protein
MQLNDQRPSLIAGDVLKRLVGLFQQLPKVSEQRGEFAPVVDVMEMSHHDLANQVTA